MYMISSKEHRVPIRDVQGCHHVEKVLDWRSSPGSFNQISKKFNQSCNTNGEVDKEVVGY